ncbi:hypothetical protein NPIL_310041 [Nephila pilipes]|uniref:Uncharacterized protein n=1 Tax=Nephila pilipes TaxID=299642 RepID=A0A8X6PNP0_NEPPI|nr:hypothetical protein NPIL_310041 [Nephila pilipes]
MIVILSLLCIALSAAVIDGSSEINDTRESFLPEKLQTLMFGRDFRNESRRARMVDEIDDEGRIVPGAPSFLTRLSIRSMMFRIVRALVQYFSDLIVGVLFN